MKDLYRRSQDIKLKDGTEVKEYTFVFNTTEPVLDQEVELYFQKIMDRDKEYSHALYKEMRIGQMYGARSAFPQIKKKMN